MKQYLIDRIVEQLQRCDDLDLLDLILKLLLEGGN